MPTYKFYYFPVRARGELTKLVLAAAGQTFTDVVVTGEEWPKYKTEMPFNQLPVLEIDGKKYGQGRALATYLAEEYNLYGKNKKDHLRIQEVVGLAGDLFEKMVKCHFEKDKDKKEELVNQLETEENPKFAQYYENLLKESKSAYFVGDSLTLADLAAYDIFENARTKNSAAFAKYPKLSENFKKVQSHPKIAAYLKTRPQREI